MSASAFGLCDRCAHQKLVTSGRGSQFSMCRLGLEDPDWPKYPQMPVLRCSRFAPAPEPSEDHVGSPRVSSTARRASSS